MSRKPGRAVAAQPEILDRWRVAWFRLRRALDARRRPVEKFSSTADYIAQVSAGGSLLVDRRQLTDDERLGDALFTGLRLVDGIDVNALQTRYGVDVWHRFGADLEPFLEAGCLRRDGSSPQPDPPGNAPCSRSDGGFCVALSTLK